MTIDNHARARVVANVKYRVTTGRLKPGDRLTTADLAITRWVTMSTAAAALQDLAEGGLLEPLPDGAYLVRERPPGTPEFAADEHAWRQLAEFLAQRVKSGEFSATGKLPAEAVIMKQYRLGRGTVRKARNELAERGLIFARQGFGFFIA